MRIQMVTIMYKNKNSSLHGTLRSIVFLVLCKGFGMAKRHKKGFKGMRDILLY